MKKLVAKLNNLLELKNMNCYELSKKTGIANTTLNTLLKGGTDKFDIVKLKKICEVLGCSLDYLMDDNIDVYGNSYINETPLHYYVSEAPSHYYVNEDVAQYAQEIANNKDLKMLFDAAKDIKKEDMQLVYEMVKRLKDSAQ